MNWSHRGLWILGTFAATVVTAALGFLAWQSALMSGAAQVEPEAMTAADLLANGPGPNAHITLTDFTFGKPVTEFQNGYARGVWVPIQPTSKLPRGAKGTVFLFRAGSTDLTGLLKQTSLNAIVSRSLPDNALWKAKGTESLWKAFPKADPTAAQILVEPDLQLGGTPQAAAWLLSPHVATVGGSLAGATGVGAIVGFFLFLMSFGRGPVSEGYIPPTDAELAPLKSDPAVSSHSVTLGDSLFLAIGALIGAGVSGYLALIMSALFINLLVNNYLLGAAIVAFLTVSGFAATFAGPAWVFWKFSHRVADIQVCPNGLRFSYGFSTLHKLWREVAAVRRQDFSKIVRNRRGEEFFVQWAVLTVHFQSGERFKVSSQSVSDFEEMARLIEQGHGSQFNSTFGRPSRNSVLNQPPGSNLPHIPWK